MELFLSYVYSVSQMQENRATVMSTLGFNYDTFLKVPNRRQQTGKRAAAGTQKCALGVPPHTRAGQRDCVF